MHFPKVLCYMCLDSIGYNEVLVEPRLVERVHVMTKVIEYGIHDMVIRYRESWNDVEPWKGF